MFYLKKLYDFVYIFSIYIYFAYTILFISSKIILYIY